MKNDLSERLRICIAIEMGMGEIYREFIRMFPQARDLWGELATAEEKHASILAIGSRYENIGKLPDFVVPDSLSHMKDTLGLIESMKATIRAGNVSISEALEMSLKLENTLEESYFLDVMTGETESETVARLQRLLTDTEAHIKKINDYMKRRGRADSDRPHSRFR